MSSSMLAVIGTLMESFESMSALKIFRNIIHRSFCYFSLQMTLGNPQYELQTHAHDTVQMFRAHLTLMPVFLYNALIHRHGLVEHR